jgi:hypothetical protein
MDRKVGNDGGSRGKTNVVFQSCNRPSHVSIKLDEKKFCGGNFISLLLGIDYIILLFYLIRIPILDLGI